MIFCKNKQKTSNTRDTSPAAANGGSLGGLVLGSVVTIATLIFPSVAYLGNGIGADNGIGL